MIELKGVGKTYQSRHSSDTKALEDINLLFGTSGLVFIVGKSGCGKSTLLNLLGGLDVPSSGEILLNGKSISRLQKDESDAYRNTYVGFVFQDFNILEQYNVYENIELALKLQNKNLSLQEMDELLRLLDLEGLEKRKINELSGGQKQRVAVARALIKHPQMILADEPTGNLDAASSTQIFEILKEISKRQLVIVVSHDLESAEHYADRIIKVADGKIVSDTAPSSEVVEKEVSFHPSHLPFSYAFKMALSNLKRKPVKLFMTILLTAISLLFMGFTVNSLLFNPIQFTTSVIYDNENYVYHLRNSKIYPLGETDYLQLDDRDFEKLSMLTKSKINPAYSLFDDGELLTFHFGENSSSQKHNSYYETVPNFFNFIELTDERVVGDVIGRLPIHSNEMVVSKYFADYAIKFGIMDSNGKLYFPKNYQDFVTSDHPIALGSNSVFIVGIRNDDDKLFLSSKEKGAFDDEDLRKYFSETYLYHSSDVYVKGFTEEAKLLVRRESILNRMSLQNSSDRIEGDLLSLQGEVSALTKGGISSFTHLSRKQILISKDSLLRLDPEFKTRFEVYASLKPDENPDQLLYELLNQYILDDKLAHLSLTLTTHNLVTFSTESIPVFIAGISLDGKDYVSDEYLKDFQPVSKRCLFVQFYNDDMKRQASILKKFPFTYDSLNMKNPGTYYTIDMKYDTTMLNVIGVYEGLWFYILIASLVFVLFTFLLYSNFLATSISYSRKEIGILRALGARRGDIIKIFDYEALVIGILSWILFMIFWFLTVYLLNKSLFDHLFFTVRGILTHPLVPFFMLVFILFFANLITFASISRITKIRPIDAILEK